MVDQKFIKNLQGKDFVLFEGLLNEAHTKGLHSISTSLERMEGGQVIFKAVVEIKSPEDPNIVKSFTGWGDADDQNVGSQVAKHKFRMAETRAIARALRFATNIGMCSVDEMGNDDSPTPNKVVSPKVNNQLSDSVNTPLVCNDCDAKISQKVADYSVNNFNRTLCMGCQDKERNKGVPVEKVE